MRHAGSREPEEEAAGGRRRRFYGKLAFRAAAPHNDAPFRWRWGVSGGRRRDKADINLADLQVSGASLEILGPTKAYHAENASPDQYNYVPYLLGALGFILHPPPAESSHHMLFPHLHHMQHILNLIKKPSHDWGGCYSGIWLQVTVRSEHMQVLRDCWSSAVMAHWVGRPHQRMFCRSSSYCPFRLKKNKTYFCEMSSVLRLKHASGLSYSLCQMFAQTSAMLCFRVPRRSF